MLKPFLPQRALATVVLVLGLSLLAGLADHHAAERVPWHDHMVFGVGQAAVFSGQPHRHAYEDAHEHSPAGRIAGAKSPAGSARIIACHEPAAGDRGIGSGLARADGLAGLTLPPVPGRLAGPLAGSFTEIVPRLPDRPPISTRTVFL